MIDLFPGKYIHIGGDEVDKSNWKKCPKCQDRIKREGLKDVNELQSYFIKRIEKFINKQGRTMIGWDEILEGGLAPNAAVMSWRGVEGGIIAANAGHDVVMTPGTHCYLDHYQAKDGEPKAIGGYSPLQHVYSYEPIPAEISADKAKSRPRRGRQPLERVLPELRPRPIHGLPPGVRDRRSHVDRSETKELGRLQTPHGNAIRAAQSPRRELSRSSKSNRTPAIDFESCWSNK